MSKEKRTGLISRPVPYLDPKLYVIATEGRETEKEYFSLFQTNRVHIELLTTGAEDSSAPQHVLARLELIKDDYLLDQDDELWLMIDIDRWPQGSLARVCADADRQGFGLAVSNPCFEVWLVLHFQEADLSDNSGRRLKQKLHKLGGSNQKNRLKGNAYGRQRIEMAIQRARALDRQTGARWPEFPGTHVYKIVQSLLPRMLQDFPS